MGNARAGAIERLSDRSFFVFNAILSVLALSFIGWILLLRDRAGSGGVDLRFLPAVNAALNGTSAVLLAAGWAAARRRSLRLHKRLVVAAFAASTVFLVSYLVYHWVHGDTKYPGQGPMRRFYLAVLASHVLLSTVVVPGALTAFWFAWRREFARHTRVTRVLMPIWLYVSVTGVLIWWLLRAATAAVPAVP